MIGSLMSRVGMAEKLSIPQLQQAIQDGTLPAYVGVPLLQQKVQQQKQSQAMATGAQQQAPSIAQQVMQEAQGVETLPSNLPAEGFADGGILNFQPVNTDDVEHEYAGGGMIAFAGGGMSDDEEDDDSTEDDFDKILRAAQEENADLLSNYRGEGTQGLESFGINPSRPSGVGVREDVKAPRGIDALEARVVRQESGGRDFDKNGNPLTSPKGAKYAMQVMPATAKDPGFGIKPIKDDSPEEYNRVGRELLSKLYQKYDGDEQLTLAAYNWGPGNVDKWVAGGRKGAVPTETRQYAGLAEGGIASIKHFAGKEGSVVTDPLGYVSFGEEAPYEDTGTSGLDAFKYLWNRNTYGTKENIMANTPSMDPTTPEGGAVPYVAGTDDTYIPELNKESRETPKVYENLNKQQQEEVSKKQEEEKTAEANTPAAKMQAYLDKMTAKVDAQREQDKYMSLMAAGLGIMGGTSPHAMANIGQGGMKGIEAQMVANKMANAQELGLAKGQLGAYTLQQNQDMRKAMAAENAKKDAYGKMGIIRNNIEKNIKSEMGLDPIANIDDKEILNKIQRQVEARLAGSPEYKGLHRIATGIDYDAGGGAMPSAPVNYQSTYGLTPKK